MDLVNRACQALAFQRGLGHEGLAGPLAAHTYDRATPDDRESNHTSRIRATSLAEIAAVFADVEQAFPHCAHRVFHCDPATPPRFVAELVARGYACRRRLVMARSANLLPRTGDLACDAVHDTRQWLRMAALLKEAVLETATDNFLSTTALRSAEQRLAGLRKRVPSYEVFILRKGRSDTGYIAGVACPSGVGVIGELFVITTARRQGLGTELLRHAAQELRDSSAHTLVLEVDPESPAHRLARVLDFMPLCVTEAYEAVRT